MVSAQPIDNFLIGFYFDMKVGVCLPSSVVV